MLVLARGAGHPDVPPPTLRRFRQPSRRRTGWSGAGRAKLASLERGVAAVSGVGDLPAAEHGSGAECRRFAWEHMFVHRPEVHDGSARLITDRSQRLRGRAPAGRAAFHGAGLAPTALLRTLRPLPALLASPPTGRILRRGLRRTPRPVPGRRPLSEQARTQRLRICLDARYGDIVGEADALLRRCFPHNRVGRVCVHDGAEVVLHVYSAHLSCLFPQHGPGKKHDREIALEGWQRDIVDAAPWAFLRGCIRSDGCVFVNRTGRYEYLSYGFPNHSSDILDLFEATASPRPAAAPLREGDPAQPPRDVARLLEHVGVKS